MSQAVFYLFSSILLLSGIMVTFARNPVHSVLYLILAFFNAAGLFILLGAELLAMLLVIVYVGAVAVLFLFVVMMMDIVPSKEVVKLTWDQVVESARLCLKFLGYLIIFLLMGSIFNFYVLPFLETQIFRTNDISLTTDTLSFYRIGITYNDIIAIVISYLVLRFGFKKSLWKIGCNFFKTISAGGLLGFIILAEMSYILAHWRPLDLPTALIPKSHSEEQHLTNTQALGKVLYTNYIMLFEIAGMILLLAMIGAIVLTHRKREGVKRQNIKEQIARRKENTLELHDLPIGKGI